MKDALIIFAKNPERGKVKTRLAATIGKDAALSVYQRLLSHTASITKFILVDKFVFYSDNILQQDVWCNDLFFKQTQEGNDLGERMKNAFAAIFRKDYSKIIIIGTDCPDLNADVITHAFKCLDSHDVVIGPAHDGGYYLLGIKQRCAQLFQNIRWSTHTVFEDTRMKCEHLNLNYSLLPTLRDLDLEEDLKYFKTENNDQHHYPDVQ